MPAGTGFGGSGGGSSSSGGRGSGFGGGKKTTKKDGALAARKAPSTVAQFTDIIKATPSGIANLAVAARDDLAATFDPRSYKKGSATAPKKGEKFTDYFVRTRPFTGQMARSFVNTGGRLTDLGASLKPGGLRPSDTKYARASREGSIVGTILEDAANATIVAGPLARGLGSGATAATSGAAKASAAGNTARAARLGKVAKAAETGQSVVRGAEHPLNLAANAGDPIFLTTRAARLAKRGLKSDAVRSTSAGQKVAARAESWSERRSARQDLANAAADISKEQDRQGRIVARQKDLLPDAAEVEASTLIRQGESKALAGLDSLPHAERIRVIDAAFSGGKRVSPEAFALARRYEDGTMPAEQRARFDEAIALVEEGQQKPRTAREVAGVGRKDGPLSAEQLGDKPLTPVVEGAVRPIRAQSQKASERAVSLRRQADRADAQAASVRDQTAQLASERAVFNATVKPATRRALNTPGEMKAVGGADMRARVLGNVAKSAEARAGRLSTKLAAETKRVSESIEAAPKRYRPALQRAADSRRELARMADEAQADGNPHAAAYLRSVADDLPKVIADLTAKGIDPSHLIGGETPQFLGGSMGKKQRFLTLRKTGGEKQSKTTNITRTAEGQGALESKRAAEAIRNVGAIHFRDKYGKTAKDLGLDPALSGDALKEAAFEAGYKPFDTSALLEGPQKIDQSTVFLRKAMSDDFSRWFDAGRSGKPMAAFHRVNRAMSLPILRLSPRWQVGNAVSQMMQLTVGAGMTPAQIVRYGAEARRMINDHPELVPARFGHSGQFSGLLSPDLDNLGRPVNKPRTPIGKLAEKSGNLNEWVDRWGKETVYLAKKAKGYSDEAAVKRALELQVDMRSMSNFERNYVQALMPYYAWARHITKLSLRLPFEHPTRVAWTLHLADLYGDDQSQLPEWLKGGIRLEDGRFVNVNSIVNPFGDVGQSPLLSPKGALSALSPALRLGAAGLNKDLASFGDLKRPAGSGPLDETGKPKVGLIAPREFANVAAQALPQTRLAAGLVGTPMARYPTGDLRIDKNGNPYPTERTRLNMLGRFAGIPTPEKIDAEAIQASAEKGRLRAAKSLANRQKRLRGRK